MKDIPEYISRSILIAAMDEWIIGDNAKRDKEILSYRILDGLTYEDTACEYQKNHPDKPLSEIQIKRIISKREQQLRKHL